MSILQGKGMWTFYDDVGIAVTLAPGAGIKYILCKISEKGKYDKVRADTALAEVRKSPGLVPVAWTYPYLTDIAAEVECIKNAFQAGFEAYIIDAESNLNFKFTEAEQFAQRVLAAGLDTARIYLCGDPRLDSKMDEIPYAQLAKICRGGFMAVISGDLFTGDRSTVASRVMNNVTSHYEKHRGGGELNYSTPLLPVLYTYWDNAGKERMSQADFKRWTDETQKHSPTFISFFRAGVTLAEIWPVIKNLKVSPTQVQVIPGEGEKATKASIVQPGGAGFSLTAFAPQSADVGWTKFVDKSGFNTWYRNIATTQTLFAQYRPGLAKVGRYIIEVFVPGTHATTRGAQYFVVHHEDGQQKETRAVIPQIEYSDEWVPLGIFTLDPKKADSGRVNLVDVTADTKPREIAFSAIRWRPVGAGGPGYDAPVGTPEERASAKIWPGDWLDANPYGKKYELGYHTGADLNLNKPFLNADKGAPIYAIADGVVTFAQEIPGSWEGLIVIDHGKLPDGKPVFSRYGHVDNILPKKGEAVTRGQQIAQVGMFGKPEWQNYHLHFDISRTKILASQPAHWPGEDLNSVMVNYVDPKKFIQDHRP